MMATNDMMATTPTADDPYTGPYDPSTVLAQHGANQDDANQDDEADDDDANHGPAHTPGSQIAMDKDDDNDKAAAGDDDNDKAASGDDNFDDDDDDKESDPATEEDSDNEEDQERMNVGNKIDQVLGDTPGESTCSPDNFASTCEF